LREAVIVTGVRTPIGKAGGCLARYDNYELGGIVIKALVERTGIDPTLIDDVFFGLAEGMPGDVARISVLEADLPNIVPGITFDRQCASGLETICFATAMIESGHGDIYIAGGVESGSNNPWFLEKSSRAYSYEPPKFKYTRTAPDKVGDPVMGETAEKVLDLYPDITREDLDRYAVLSHERALEAMAAGAFDEQIVPVSVKIKGETVQIAKDECPRKTSIEQLAKLKSAFRKDGKVTAGNSCPMNDGAAAVLVMSKDKAEELKLPYLLVVRDFATVGLDQHVMGLGPINAVKKLVKKTGISLDQVDMIELNEAFASQAIACIRELKLDMGKVNVNGGAIALGHPMGATGTILTMKLAYALKKANKKYGIVTMCVGGGQGTAALFERP